MSDDITAIVPPICTITTEQVAPSSEMPPGDSDLPPPTAEQQAVADHVCTDPHPAVTLLGVWTSAMILRDVAVDTFDTSGEDEEDEDNPKRDKDAK